jgi:TonB family protein
MIAPRLTVAACLAVIAMPAVAQAPRRINISPFDYPADVAPGGEALTVEVRYELGDDGRFATCAVTKSSGHPSLDAASCRLLQERARFRPERGTRRGRLELRWLNEASRGLNPAGAPIPVSLHDEITSDDYPPAANARNESGTVSYDVLVSASGVPRRCTVSESSGSAALDRRTCEIVMERSAFIPASNGAGGSAAAVYRSRIRWIAGGRQD